MATKIKGSAGRNEAYPGQAYRFTDLPPSIGEPATLVLGDEPVYTASEVRAILDEAELLARTMGALVMDADEAKEMAASDMATIKVRHGITLDPA